MADPAAIVRLPWEPLPGFDRVTLRLLWQSGRSQCGIMRIQAEQHGASRDEVISAVLVGLQPAGHGVTACLPGALQAYDDTA